MEGKAKSQRRLTIVARTVRARRIFDRLCEGWSHDDIASARHSTERIRQIVTQALEKRFDDTPQTRARLRLDRLRPAPNAGGPAIFSPERCP